MKEYYDPSKYASRQVGKNRFPVLIDLDGTLAKSVWPKDGIGEPLEGAKEAVQQLKEHGKQIVVYTARASYEARAIWRWLIDNGIRVDNVATGKESGHFYIGDEAIGHRGDWGETMREARERFLK